MSAIRDYLDPNEQVIDRFSSVKFNETTFDCALTNRRILLYGREKKQSKDINYESINKLSLEKEWYAEFFLFMIMALIIGSIWFISAIYYSYIQNTNINLQTPIMVIRALLYPGLILLCIALGGSYIYFTRMKLHILIVTPQENFQLFSTQKTLGDISKIYEFIKSGEIRPFEGEIPAGSLEQRLSEKPIATFGKIDSRITFKDDNNRRKSIALYSIITLTESFIYITSKRLKILKENNIYEKYTQNKEVPLITEENLSNIFDLARELNIFYFLLMDFRFDLRKSSLVDSHFYTGPVGSTGIFLQVNTPTGEIVIEFKKTHIFSNTPAKEILEIKKLIKDILKTN